jgi:hypothetical protein
MGIQILNGEPTQITDSPKVRVKPGRLRSGSFGISVGVAGKPFGYKGASPALEYPDNFSTLPSTSLATTVPQYDPAPLANFHNTATKVGVGAAIRIDGVDMNPRGKTPMIQLHERGRYFQEKVLPLVRPNNSVNQQSNTPFHPKKESRPKNPPAHSAVLGERTALPSFQSTGTMTAGGWSPNGRWATVKRGAAG